MKPMAWAFPWVFPSLWTFHKAGAGRSLLGGAHAQHLSVHPRGTPDTWRKSTTLVGWWLKYDLIVYSYNIGWNNKFKWRCVVFSQSVVNRPEPGGTYWGLPGSGLSTRDGGGDGIRIFSHDPKGPKHRRYMTPQFFRKKTGAVTHDISWPIDFLLEIGNQMEPAALDVVFACFCHVFAAQDHTELALRCLHRRMGSHGFITGMRHGEDFGYRITLW